MDLKERVVCVLSALTALGNETQLRHYVRAALRVGLTRQEVAEALAQCAGYAGVPSTLNALGVAKAVFDEPPR